MFYCGIDIAEYKHRVAVTGVNGTSLPDGISFADGKERWKKLPMPFERPSFAKNALLVGITSMDGLSPCPTPEDTLCISLRLSATVCRSRIELKAGDYIATISGNGSTLGAAAKNYKPFLCGLYNVNAAVVDVC